MPSALTASTPEAQKATAASSSRGRNLFVVPSHMKPRLSQEDWSCETVGCVGAAWAPSVIGVVKDIATHTAGTVVQPGTVMLTLVPVTEKLRAEVMVSNEDIGFVRVGQPVKIKLAAFPFQKYGMLDGRVEHVSADAQDRALQEAAIATSQPRQNLPLSFKTLVALDAMNLKLDGAILKLNAGMQTTAEIKLGEQTVMEYLLSPVRKAFHEAARER